MSATTRQVLILAVSVCISQVAAPQAVDAQVADAQVDYLRDVKPVLKARCFACHGALKQESGLRLDTGELIRRGGDGGPVVVGGEPNSSSLLERIAEPDADARMPPDGEPLTAEQIGNLAAWIAQGAPSPEDEEPEPSPEQHWAFNPPVKARLPATGDSSSAGDSQQTHPIDAFINARLQRQHLTAQPAAPRHVQLRRLYLDLIGLPPTAEELQTFLNDESPSAWQTVVDRLLNDPRHGERWARHWMDVWRYSDWYGRRHVPDVWNSAPQIWRWRDWIVRSLNADHGYDRMVREMLAADELCPDDDDAVVATGYLVRNWYALNPNDWMRNTVEHTGKAFLGLTFNCAHCHDHKYDPIEHEDYFRFRAFFEPLGLRQDQVPGQPDPGPFQEYEYGKLRKIQRLGAIRVFDKSPDAPTWFYTGGDERNRVTERGSIAPGIPAFLKGPAPEIQTVQLPETAWYPGLRPAIHEAALNEARTAVAEAEAALSDVQTPAQNPSSETQQVADQDHLAPAEAAFSAALETARQAGRPGALSGQQSLLITAGTGRRILNQRLAELNSLDNGTTLAFELLILKDAHFNFQLAKDVVKGLTAGYIGFNQGRIVSYQPGSFTEFEVGRYDFENGQTRFDVLLRFRTDSDHCLLTVTSVPDGARLVDQVTVALNGWNPVGDDSKAISIDCRTGCAVVIDDVTVNSAATDSASADSQASRPLVHLNFEPPAHTVDQDVVGTHGWSLSSFSTAPGTSTVSAIAANAQLQQAWQQLVLARRGKEAKTLPQRAAQAKLIAAQAAFASLEARIAADRAKYANPPAADASALALAAGRQQRQAAVLQAEAQVLADELALATAESKPADDEQRGKETEAAGKALNASREKLRTARAAQAEKADSASYTPFSPTYPETSTGRRKALAEWITNRRNPLTARVAVNHIWTRHFHSPLVSTVTDFGRNGATPTHPELLDWLAVELMEQNWSMKHLHRLIVTSSAYRRASSAGTAGEHGFEFHPAHAHDPENRLLWRMNTGRMEAEVLRDSLLYVAGKLDLTMGGQELENTEALTTFRRSLYYSVFPEQGGKSALGELFDAPDALECYRRTRSIVPQQALALTNSELVHQVSQQIVSNWNEEHKTETANDVLTTPDRDLQFITTMFLKLLNRSPEEAELQLCLDGLNAQRQLSEKTDSAQAGSRARESLVRALLNHNDFVSIR
ncbi:MAG: DUF1553 domain-containing protein [Fuerstiella sp.]